MFFMVAMFFTIAMAAAIGSLSSIIGMYLSYYIDVPSGAAIVLVAGSFFLLAFLFSPSQGVLTRPELQERAIKFCQRLTRVF